MAKQAKTLEPEDKCRTCFLLNRRCDGNPPFDTKCSTCRRKKSRCVIQGTKNQLKSEKCQRCLNQGSICDGKPPFTTRCSACLRSGARCVAQGIIFQQRPLAKREPSHGEQAKTLEPEDKCRACFIDKRRCDGNPPFDTKCSTCRTRKSICLTQLNYVRREEPLQPKEDKCISCAYDHLKCNQKQPCDSCQRSNKPCTYSQTSKSITSIKERCNPCNPCKSHQRLCDGGRACNWCTKKGKRCEYSEGDIIWTYEPNQQKWHEPTKAGQCEECLKRYKLTIGTADTCDGQVPCHCCQHQAFGAPRIHCTVYLHGGVTKRSRLQDSDKLSRLRASHDKARERARQRTKQRRLEDASRLNNGTERDGPFGGAIGAHELEGEEAIGA